MIPVLQLRTLMFLTVVLANCGHQVCSVLLVPTYERKQGDRSAAESTRRSSGQEFGATDENLRNANRGQTSFDAVRGIQNPAPIPEGVLSILRKDEFVLNCVPEGQSADAVPGSWFAASEVKLDDDALLDLVVMPKNPCLFGANIVPFWVFRNRREGYRLVLDTSVFALSILKRKTAGLRDIELVSFTATDTLEAIYKFTGKEYCLHSSRRSSRQ